MSFCRKFYEIVVAKALRIVKFHNKELAPCNAPSINRLKAASRQCASPAKIAQTTAPLSSIAVATESSAGKSLGIVCGVTSVAAIVAEKERESAVRRARVTSTRLTALKTYLDQDAD